MKKKVLISYEKNDNDNAQRLYKDLSEKGINIQIESYENFYDTNFEQVATDFLNNYSYILTLLPHLSNKHSQFFKKLISEMNKAYLVNEFDLIPILTTTPDENSFIEYNHNFQLTPVIIPESSKRLLSFANYEQCLNILLKILNPPQLKLLENNHILRFQWDVTCDFYKLPVDRRLEICKKLGLLNDSEKLNHKKTWIKALTNANLNNKLQDLWNSINEDKGEAL